MNSSIAVNPIPGVLPELGSLSLDNNIAPAVPLGRGSEDVSRWPLSLSGRMPEQAGIPSLPMPHAFESFDLVAALGALKIKITDGMIASSMDDIRSWGEQQRQLHEQRVLAGRNMGAETSLGEGIWLIGSHEADDLVFADSELVSSHIRMVIQAGSLHITALADGVFIGKNKVATNRATIVAPFAPIRVGRTIFNVGPLGDKASGVDALWKQGCAFRFGRIKPARPPTKTTPDCLDIAAIAAGSDRVLFPDWSVWVLGRARTAWLVYVGRIDQPAGQENDGHSSGQRGIRRQHG